MNQTLGVMWYGLALAFSGGLMIGMFRLANNVDSEVNGLIGFSASVYQRHPIFVMLNSKKGHAQNGKWNRTQKKFT